MNADDIRRFRVNVFQETMSLAEQGWYETESGKRVEFGSESAMQKGSKMYRIVMKADEKPKVTEQTRVEVVEEDCLTFSKRLLFAGLHPAVLNMASWRIPGGGVINGSGAQEENLFRRTNLYRSLYQFAPFAEQYGLKKSLSQYPISMSTGGVYTPEATVFRGLESDGYPLLDEPFKMSFISVPAVSHPDLTLDGMLMPSDEMTTREKIRTILRIGLLHDHDSLVLGAFGCGAYGNPPKHVARLFHETFAEEEFAGKYRMITFAIINDQNAHSSHNPDGNYLPFSREFR